MATTVDRLMDLSPDVADYRAAMAARGTQSEEKDPQNPNEPFGVATVRKIHSEQSSQGGNWLENILSLMYFPDPMVRRRDLNGFNSLRMVRLVGVLEADATLDVNFDRMTRAGLIGQLPLIFDPV